MFVYGKQIQIIFFSIFITFSLLFYGQEITKSSIIETYQGKKYYIHTVKKGETLYSIAKAYNVSIDAIAYENPDVFNGLKPDEQLKIPIQATNYTITIDHEVQKGETLYGIAKKYGVTIEEIVQLNPEVSSGLKVGSIIKIPKREISSADYSKEKTDDKTNELKHVVSKGETIYGISKKYNISIEKLYELNPELKSNGLKAGQVLLIRQSENKNSQISKQVNNNLNTNLNTDNKNNNQNIVLPEKIDNNATIANCNKLLYPINSIKIALFIPLMNDLVAIEEDVQNSKDVNFKLSSKPYLEFYEGFLLALDTIKKAGINVDVLLYDIKKDSLKVNQLLADSKLEQVDLIIGPFHENVFEVVAAWAERKNIPIINPVVSTSKAVFNHYNVIHLNTNLNSQLDQYIKYLACFDSLSLIFVHNNTPEENKIVNLYKKKYLQEFSNNFKNLPLIKEVNYNQDGINGLETSLSKQKINVIILTSNSQVFVINLLTKLNELTKTYKIVATFMPSWKKFENNIDLEHIYNLNTLAFMPFYVDYSNSSVINFIKNYKFYFKTDPSKFSFLGYDIGFYFMNILHYYGKNFYNCINDTSINTLSSKFYFEKASKKGGFQNIGNYIIRYNYETNEQKIENIITDKPKLPLYFKPIAIRKPTKY